jgi:hypothetical protein
MMKSRDKVKDNLGGRLTTVKDHVGDAVDAIATVPAKVTGKERARKRSFAGLGLIPLISVGGAAFYALKSGKGRALGWEMRKRSHMGNFVEHDHGPVTHEHDHSHITHNRRHGPDMVWGEWEHLTSMHTHLHNHPPLVHAHLPHVDQEHEHLGEAHIHDHEHPATSS